MTMTTPVADAVHDHHRVTRGRGAADHADPADPGGPPPVALDSDDEASDPSRGRLVKRPGLARVCGAGAMAVAALVWALPLATGATWSGVGSVLFRVSVTQLLSLVVLWAAGLVAYSFVLTGALPGLSRRRALTLNLTGSAVSNVAPAGGAFGVTVNLMMVRTWRFRPSAFAAFAVVTNIWDVLGKLVLPLVALLGGFLSGGFTSTRLQAAALTTAVAVIVVLLAVVVVLRSDAVAAGLARETQALLRWAVPQRLGHRVEGLERALLGTRDQVREVIAGAWGQLTAGMAGYLFLQWCLLWSCLHVVGANAPLHVVVIGFALERILTLAVITPGGAGLAEAGTAGVLVALGVNPVLAAAGVLLYRCFTFLLEIPVGGLWLAGWVTARGRTRRRSA